MCIIEALFTPTPAGGFAFVADASQDESQDWCELHVSFDIAAIYKPETDNGSGLTWDGDIAAIELVPVTGIWRQRRLLAGADFAAAKAFLLREHGAALWQAGSAEAEDLFYGEAA